MSTIVNTNVPALSAQRALFRTSGELATSLQRLASGRRINSAKDDAAGLTIAERLTSQVRGYNQAIRNAADAISLAQTAEGGLVAVAQSLQRIRELAVQSANYTNANSDRAALDQEAQQMIEEIDRVTVQTRFNGQALLDGSMGVAVFQVGANVGETITIPSIGDLRTTALKGDVDPGPTLTTFKFVADIQLSSVAEANEAIYIVDGALEMVNTARAALGSAMNRFEQTITNLRVTAENQTASRSRIQDADFAIEAAAVTRAQLLQQSGMEFLQLANAMPRNVLRLLS